MEHEVDGWISQLSQCKQLSEADVKKLCDKVCPSEMLAPIRGSATFRRLQVQGRRSLSEYAHGVMCIPADAGNLDGRVQRAAGAVSCDCLW